MIAPEYTCIVCGGPAWGRYCPGYCWWESKGLIASVEPFPWSDETLAAHAALPTRFHSGETERERIVREESAATFEPGEMFITCPVCSKVHPAIELECDCGQLLDMAVATAYETPRDNSCVACGGTGRNSRGGDCVPCAKRAEAA